MVVKEQVWEGERVKAEKVTQEVDEDIFAAVAAEAEGVDPEALWDALVAAREALEATTPELYPDFMWVVRGGQWLMQSKGLGYDSLRGQAKGALAQKWCAMYNLTGTATFAVRAYTEPVAQQFAIEWCARRQYFFDAWKDAGCQDNWAYPEAVLDGCPERPDFTAAVASATGQTRPLCEQSAPGVGTMSVAHEEQPVGPQGVPALGVAGALRRRGEVSGEVLFLRMLRAGCFLGR